MSLSESSTSAGFSSGFNGDRSLETLLARESGIRREHVPPRGAAATPLRTEGVASAICSAWIAVTPATRDGVGGVHPSRFLLHSALFWWFSHTRVLSPPS
jgi:hypothetical protein